MERPDKEQISKIDQVFSKSMIVGRKQSLERHPWERPIFESFWTPLPTVRITAHIYEVRILACGRR